MPPQLRCRVWRVVWCIHLALKQHLVPCLSSFPRTAALPAARTGTKPDGNGQCVPDYDECMDVCESAASFITCKQIEPCPHGQGAGHARRLLSTACACEHDGTTHDNAKCKVSLRSRSAPFRAPRPHPCATAQAPRAHTHRLPLPATQRLASHHRHLGFRTKHTHAMPTPVIPAPPSPLPVLLLCRRPRRVA